MSSASVVQQCERGLLTRADRKWHEHATDRAGDYELKHGLLNLQFSGGVMVYIEAPARFNVGQRSNVWYLRSGRSVGDEFLPKELGSRSRLPKRRLLTLVLSSPWMWNAARVRFMCLMDWCVSVPSQLHQRNASKFG